MPRRLVVLSQDSELQSTILLALGQMAFRIEETDRLEEALMILQQFERSVVLVDADTPGVEIEGALSRLREQAKNAPLIVVTSDDSVETGKQIVEQGVFFYTVKPVNIWEMGAIVGAAWQRAEAESRIGKT